MAKLFNKHVSLLFYAVLNHCKLLSQTHGDQEKIHVSDMLHV